MRWRPRPHPRASRGGPSQSGKRGRAYGEPHRNTVPHCVSTSFETAAARCSGDRFLFQIPVHTAAHWANADLQSRWVVSRGARLRNEDRCLHRRCAPARRGRAESAERVQKLGGVQCTEANGMQEKRATPHQYSRAPPLSASSLVVDLLVHAMPPKSLLASRWVAVTQYAGPRRFRRIRPRPGNPPSPLLDHAPARYGLARSPTRPRCSTSRKDRRGSAMARPSRRNHRIGFAMMRLPPSSQVVVYSCVNIDICI